LFTTLFENQNNFSVFIRLSEGQLGMKCQTRVAHYLGLEMDEELMEEVEDI